MWDSPVDKWYEDQDQGNNPPLRVECLMRTPLHNRLLGLTLKSKFSGLPLRLPLIAQASTHTLRLLLTPKPMNKLSILLIITKCAYKVTNKRQKSSLLASQTRRKKAFLQQKSSPRILCKQTNFASNILMRSLWHTRPLSCMQMQSTRLSSESKPQSRELHSSRRGARRDSQMLARKEDLSNNSSWARHRQWSFSKSPKTGNSVKSSG